MFCMDLIDLNTTFVSLGVVSFYVISSITQIQGAEGNLYGHVLRYILIFSDNYLGYMSSFVTTEQFMRMGRRNMVAHNQFLKYNQVN